jgi:hypothetical protein
LTSGDFSIGLGFTANEVTWNDIETAGANTPTTIGDFTFTPAVVSSNNSSGGVNFINRVLGGGPSDRSANGDGFLATVVGTYTGPTPADAAPVPNYRVTLDIDEISLYVAVYDAAASPFHFQETTAANPGVSPDLTDDFVGGNNANTPSTYTKAVWNPGDFQEIGTTSTRTFKFPDAEAATANLQIDGFEILGNVILEYDSVVIPEPASILLLAAIGAAAAFTRYPRQTVRV